MWLCFYSSKTVDLNRPLNTIVQILKIFFVDNFYLKNTRLDMQYPVCRRIQFCTRKQTDLKKSNLKSYTEHVKLQKIKGLKYSSDTWHASGVIIPGCFDATQRNCYLKQFLYCEAHSKKDTIETRENASYVHADQLAD